MSQETSRLSDCCCIGGRISAGRRRNALAAGTLAGALLLGSPAVAQEAAGDIEERIESTFALVLGNTAELAIPLTRRALARRLSDDEPKVSPLAYGTIEPDAPSDAAVVEEGSAEDPEDVARMPRPRPVGPDDPAVEVAGLGVGGPAEETETADAVGGPLDLVAAPPEAFAASELAAEAIASVPPPNPADQAASAPDLVAAPTQPSPDQLELVASGACLSLGDVTDKDDDFKRNSLALSDSTLCIAEEQFKERRRTWTIATVKTGRPGPLFAVMHDDEDMSFDNAVAALKAYGGTLVAIETGGKRNQDGIDPNRNFSADGIGCRKLGKDAAPKFTEFFRSLFDSSQPILALHNNTGERIPTGGLGHVSMGDLPKSMEARKGAEPDGPLAGDRALVLLTSAVPVTTNAEARAEELNAKGINAVIEPVREGKGDCSLSNYALLVGHPQYFNVTVDKDEGEKQLRIIDAILAKPGQTVAAQ